MSHTPNYDTKVKAILDGLTPGETVCEMTGEKWLMDAEEMEMYRRFNVPPSQKLIAMKSWPSGVVSIS